MFAVWNFVCGNVHNVAENLWGTAYFAEKCLSGKDFKSKSRDLQRVKKIKELLHENRRLIIRDFVDVDCVLIYSVEIIIRIIWTLKQPYHVWGQKRSISLKRCFTLYGQMTFWYASKNAKEHWHKRIVLQRDYFKGNEINFDFSFYSKNHLIFWTQ